MRIRKRQDRRKGKWEVKRNKFYDRRGMSIRSVEWRRKRREGRKGNSGENGSDIRSRTK